MRRVQSGLFVLSFGSRLRVEVPLAAGLVCALLAVGCTTASLRAAQPVYVHPADAPVAAPPKIVRFADALGAVAPSAEGSKLQSMLEAFNYCDREQRLAFVTPPMIYSPHVNYARVSTYSMRFSESSAAGAQTPSSYVAPFECIDQKHAIKTGLLESEDVPSGALHHVVTDTRGGVIVHRAQPGSAFRENDIVVSVGEFRIGSRAEFVKAIDLAPLGELAIEVVRGGERIRVSGTVIDKTPSVRETALQLLEALCKETGSTARSCATHNFLAAN